MRATVVFFVLILACTAAFAAEDAAAVCKPFIDRNETCREALQETCITVLKAKMLEQIEAAPAGFQDQMRQGLDEKVLGFCNGFLGQTTGAQALGMCTEKMGGSDPGTAEQAQDMKVCLAKETCRDYADCAVKFD